MNALIRKETRMLLPTWIGALVAATAPLWLWHELEGIVSTVFGAAIVALALSPFGLETSYGTFGLLLVQPEERRRFWRIKAWMLAVALVSAWMLFAVCLWTRVWADNDGFDVLKWSALMTLLAFSGGLWSTLLLRDMVSAFFCSCLLPAIICAVTLAAASHWISPDSERFTTILYWILGAYAVAGVVWARRLFLNAQDVPWTGGQISLSSVRGMSLRWLAFELKGRTNRWAALARKELQLQEVTMVLIPVLALLHLVVAVLCYFHPLWSEKEQILATIPIIWMASVPFIIGCGAVAEERRLNILESLLCLPMSKRASFTLKFAVALVLGIVLGGIIPWALMHISGHALKGFEWQDAVTIAACITGIAFYASTISRGLLQAVPTALCVATVMYLTIVLLFNFFYSHGNNFELVQSSLFPALTWPAMLSTFVWLAFNNYKRLHIGWRVWVGDFTRVGAVFGCVLLVNVAVFDRTWELFMPLEPRHGPARLFGTGRANIGVSGSGLDIVLPDGRLWIGKQLWNTKTFRTGKMRRISRTLKGISGGFANGSNWVKVAADRSGVIALQSDGTLWKVPNTSDTTQIGSDSDWQEIAAGGGIFMAVKQDGTLWGWGLDYNNILIENSSSNKSGIRVADPIRVGNDSDWANVFIIGDNLRAIGVKRDGTAWRWGQMALAVYHELHSVRQMVREKMEGGDWLAMSGMGNATLGIRTDGSLWVVGQNIPPTIFNQMVMPGRRKEPERVGTKSDWIALSGNWQQTALEANGTLWAMSINWSPINAQSKHPSKYTDWLAATETYDHTWALAKDGTLSCWNEFGINWPEDGATFMQRFFLGPTRRPIISVNILDKRL